MLKYIPELVEKSFQCCFPELSCFLMIYFLNRAFQKFRMQICFYPNDYQSPSPSTDYLTNRIGILMSFGIFCFQGRRNRIFQNTTTIFIQVSEYFNLQSAQKRTEKDIII